MNEIECAECATSIETEGGVNRWVAHAFADRMGWKSYRVENEWKVSCPACLHRWSDAARRNRELWDFREYWNLRMNDQSSLQTSIAQIRRQQTDRYDPNLQKTKLRRLSPVSRGLGGAQ